MKAQREFEKRINQKVQEIQGLKSAIQELKSKLERAEAYVEAYRDSLKVFQKTTSDNGSTTIRPNSQIDKARQVLLEAGKPMHVSELLRCMGKELTKKNRISLSGSLGLYVRQKDTFSRPAPNTFGLIEFGDDESSRDVEEILPTEFGST